MSQPWLKFLEFLGSPLQGKAPTADVFAPGFVSEGGWYEFIHYEALFRLYGPHPDSVWHPYHCPTLFAAIDKLRILPRPIATSEEVTGPQPGGAWSWLSKEVAVVVDLPGGLAVQLGARLLVEGGAQLVSTFDHWPRANPLPPIQTGDLRQMTAQPWPPQAQSSSVAIDSRDIIDCMASLAPHIYGRIQQGIQADAPPVWICDSRRMKAAKPGPGDYDNRYFIDDSILPSAQLFKHHGIRHIVYFGYSRSGDPSPDIAPLFAEAQQAGVGIARAALNEPETWSQPVEMEPPRVLPFSGTLFPKARVGGFGKRIPEPTEGGGGGFRGGYYGGGRVGG